ncbi:hypothetical protein XENTR_v10015968 [Xenopus tropicalis]|nr:hypothetical protein XENTR_v10015968 [Xenopus tropicalis]
MTLILNLSFTPYSNGLHPLSPVLNFLEILPSLRCSSTLHSIWPSPQFLHPEALLDMDAGNWRGVSLRCQ